MGKSGIRKLLRGRLSADELNVVYKSYDIVGDVAIIRVPKKLEKQTPVIAEALMQLHRNVKAVWRQASGVGGEFRLRKLEHVAGEERTLTTYIEYGCVFKVDLEKCYFSPRLSFERMRIAGLVEPREIVVNMFAGVGSFSVIIAKHCSGSKIYSIDLNPIAFQFMWENILLNKVLNQVIPLKGDAQTIIIERLQGVANRVLMPLPEKAFEYLDVAVLALKPRGGWIHYYDFEHAKTNGEAIAKVEAKVSEKLSKMSVGFVIHSSRVVRDTGPLWRQIALDIQIRKCL